MTPNDYEENRFPTEADARYQCNIAMLEYKDFTMDESLGVWRCDCRDCHSLRGVSMFYYYGERMHECGHCHGFNCPASNNHRAECSTYKTDGTPNFCPANEPRILIKGGHL